MERAFAADDFAAIRTRLEELRRERERGARKENDGAPSRQRPVEDWKTKVVPYRPGLV